MLEVFLRIIVRIIVKIGDFARDDAHFYVGHRAESLELVRMRTIVRKIQISANFAHYCAHLDRSQGARQADQWSRASRFALLGSIRADTGSTVASGAQAVSFSAHAARTKKKAAPKSGFLTPMRKARRF
ncbi:hypothetical protein [Paraburkholderia oxyphila]|uniref:hypothetical protein n=1 Tax=Paraburkholderia oxyphila TaxID=614212 RepID=UPI0012EE1FCF|nr:hypothetical protein [Paraburkholderia oxyphila]